MNVFIIHNKPTTYIPGIQLFELTQENTLRLIYFRHTQKYLQKNFYAGGEGFSGISK